MKILQVSRSFDPCNAISWLKLSSLLISYYHFNLLFFAFVCLITSWFYLCFFLLVCLLCLWKLCPWRVSRSFDPCDASSWCLFIGGCVFKALFSSTLISLFIANIWNWPICSHSIGCKNCWLLVSAIINDLWFITKLFMHMPSGWPWICSKVADARRMV